MKDAGWSVESNYFDESARGAWPVLDAYLMDLFKVSSLWPDFKVSKSGAHSISWNRICVRAQSTIFFTTLRLPTSLRQVHFGCDISYRSRILQDAVTLNVFVE